LETTKPRGVRVVLLDSLPIWGGGQKWCVQAATALRERGHRPFVVCARGGALEQRARAAGLDPRAFSFTGARALGTALALRRLVREERVQVVVSNVGRDLRLGALACATGGARLVQRRGIARPIPRDPLSRWLYSRRVARVITNSAAIRACMLDGAGFVDPGRFVVIPNGIDTRVPAAGERARLRRELGLSLEVPVAGAIGRLSRMKGHALLLEAFAGVRERLPSTVLLLAGTGEEETPLRRRAEELGLRECVRFLGFREDVDDVLAALDVFVLASVRDEGCNNALLEAMWHGLPAVVTRCGGLGEPVLDGQTGTLVPVADPGALGRALAALLADPAARARMGTAAREHVARRYSLARATDALEELLLELTSVPCASP
jgi:glycosyltransferase involved in cell wall biosynthesis